MNNMNNNTRTVKRVHWKSPFFVKCKFGVLQYVLLKIVLCVAVLILEFKGWYKEGDFSWKRGYLYICILTNVSQCWALYCLIFFYYATHTELSPIRPVGKFLSVKALVFFTWWQSVIIAILYQMDMIPHYIGSGGGFGNYNNPGAGAGGSPGAGGAGEQTEWSKEDVAKGIQDYLICMEMFVIAVVHTFIFPHSEYAPQAVQARARALNQTPMVKGWHKKRLGRSKYYHHHYYGNQGGLGASTMSANNVLGGLGLLHSQNASEDGSRSSLNELEMGTLDCDSGSATETWDDLPRSISPGLSNDDRDASSTIRSNPSWDPALEDDLLRLPGSLEPVQDNDFEDDEDETDAPDDDEDEDETDVDERYDDDDDDDDDGDDGDGDDDDDDYDEAQYALAQNTNSNRPGFVSALFDSAIPRDLRDNTVGIVKGDYNVERKTLLHHATTSDQYDLFTPNRRPYHRKPDP
jgi:hypothetical protein